MTNAVYFASGIAAIGGIWLLWDVALKSLLLDALRERVFALRFALFEMGLSNELLFDGDTYRSLEILLNGVLRYAERFTFMTWIFSVRRQAIDKKNKEYEDIGQQIALKVSRLPHETQVKIQGLLGELNSAIYLYIACTSLFFLASAICYGILRATNLIGTSLKHEVANVLEQEAYRVESRNLQLAPA